MYGYVGLTKKLLLNVIQFYLKKWKAKSFETFYLLSCNVANTVWVITFK